LKVFNQAVQAYRDAGVKVIEIDSPTEQDFRLCNSMGLILSRCEAATYHRTLDADPSLYTLPVYEQLDEASKVPAILYLQAQRFRDEFRQRMLAQLGTLDALLMPTCRVPAPKSNDVERFFLTLSLNCIPWSFIGFPTISVPCGFTPEGLPVGTQLVAGPMEDGRLLAMAAGLESGLDGE
jgi:aspartyl-tRNA(Asn)/glutamyl-tRNA(Gln) amidotransferase subunit A